MMAVEATGSKYKQKTGYIITAVFLAISAYCLYDGWINDKFIKDHTDKDGRPEANLQANRYYIPAAGILLAIYEVIGSLRLAGKRWILDDRSLTGSGGLSIPLGQITTIDQRFFQSEGHFTIGYNSPQGPQKLKLSDRNYDNLVAIFDELVKQTGAAPTQPSPASPAHS
jgi:hypothetical protein